MSILEVLGNIGFDWQVALANLINFLVVFWLLKRYAFKPLMGIIRERQAKIQEGLEHAQSAEAEFVVARQQSENIISDARKEANGIVAIAHDRGENLVTEATSKAQLQAERIAENAERDAKKEYERILSEFKEQAASLVVSGIEKILREEVTKEQSVALSKKALAHMKS